MTIAKCADILAHLELVDKYWVAETMNTLSAKNIEKQDSKFEDKLPIPARQLERALWQYKRLRGMCGFAPKLINLHTT